MTASAVEILADKTASAFARRRAAEQVVGKPEQHPGGMDALLVALETEDQYLHRNLLEIAAKWDHPHIRGHLRDCLGRDDAYIQRQAMEALGRIGDEEDVALLRQWAEGGDYMLSVSARRAMETLVTRFPAAAAATAQPPAAEPSQDAHDSREPPAPEAVEEPLDQASPADAPPETMAVEEPPVLPDTPDEPPVQQLDTSEPEPIDEPEAIVEPEPAAESKPVAEPEPVVEPEPVAESKPAIEPERVPVPARMPPPLPPLLPVAVAKPPPLARDPGPAEGVDPAPVAGRDWSRARRHQLFLGNRLSAMQMADTSLHAHEAAVPDLEAVWMDLTGRLEYLRADTGDDLAAAEDAVQQAEGRLNGQQIRQKRLVKRKQQMRERQNSVSLKIASLFSDRARKAVDEESAQLDAEMEACSRGIEEDEALLEQARDQARTLQQALSELERQTVGAREALDQALELVDADTRLVQEIILEILQQAPDLEQRLQAMRAIDPMDGVLAAHCRQHVAAAAEHLRCLEAQEEVLQRRITTADQAAAGALESLGEGVAEGFRFERRMEQLRVAVRAQIGFKEEGGLFRGYSNASGNAQGSGTVSGSYELEQLSWSPPAGMGGKTMKLREYWEALGHACAERAHRHNQVLQQRSRLAEYAHTIRSILARDWIDQEGRP